MRIFILHLALILLVVQNSNTYKSSEDIDEEEVKPKEKEGKGKGGGKTYGKSEEIVEEKVNTTEAEGKGKGKKSYGAEEEVGGAEEGKGGSSKSKVKVCSKDMTEDDRKRCKTVCDNEGKGSETFYDFKRVQYDYTDKNIIHMGKDGEKAGLAKIPPEKSFKDYKGKVLLVVNLSSFCTLAVQYVALNALKKKYKGKDFEILGFPGNEFAKYEPGYNASEIYHTLKYVRPGQQQWVKDAGYPDGFVPNFPMMEKGDVNGKEPMPVYKFLKSRCEAPMQEFYPLAKLNYDNFHQNDLRWSFEKFLVDKQGKPVLRYALLVTPGDLEADIDHLLKGDVIDKDE